MADLTSVGVTSGVPSSGTGTVATLNYLTQVGAPISNGSTSAPVTVAITGSASAVTSTMSALVVSLSPNSSVRTFTLSSNATVILSSNPTVILSSNPTITSISSGVVAIGNGANVASVKATLTPATSADLALVVALSPNNPVTTTGSSIITSVSSGTVAIANGSNIAAVKGAAISPSSADPALVVAISPNSINPNGQTVMVNSAPVTIASDQSAILVTPSSNATVVLSSNPTVIPSSVIGVTLVPATTGGLTLSSVIMSSGTNSTLISSVPRQIYKIECFNSSGTIAYLHLYNLSSAPTAGSSLVFDRIMVPGNASGGAGVVTTTELGIPFGTGLGYTFTGGVADSDTTAVLPGTYIVNVYYR